MWPTKQEQDEDKQAEMQGRGGTNPRRPNPTDHPLTIPRKSIPHWEGCRGTGHSCSQEDTKGRKEASVQTTEHWKKPQSRFLELRAGGRRLCP